jgi:large subunit ribosomal protein L14
MIQPHTRLRVADNSGATRVMSIRVLGGGKKYGRVGDVLIVVVKKSVPNMPVKRSQLVRAVIVRTKQALRRSDGSRVRFDDNAAVIVSRENKPIGTRVFGPVARELKSRGFSSVVSLSDVVI